MKCPHCLTSFHSSQKKAVVVYDDHENANWFVVSEVCPNPDCNKAIIHLNLSSNSELRLVYPKSISRNPLSTDVPDEFAEDYNEACLVLSDSPKASAALSRRCLQNLIREVEKVKNGDLFDEIQEVLDSNKLPSHLAETLDSVRTIGNFGAHAIKSKQSGKIVKVEPGEAEWNLEALEGLFDYYFVAPKKTQARKAAWNAKLKDAGKNPLK